MTNELEKHLEVLKEVKYYTHPNKQKEIYISLSFFIRLGERLKRKGFKEWVKIDEMKLDRNKIADIVYNKFHGVFIEARNSSKIAKTIVSSKDIIKRR